MTNKEIAKTKKMLSTGSACEPHVPALFYPGQTIFCFPTCKMEASPPRGSPFQRVKAEPARKAGCIWPRSERWQTGNETTAVLRDEQ